MNQTTADVMEIVRERGITEVLHFTTNAGLLGVLATGAIKSRAHLDADKYLEFIFTGNVKRKDLRWTGHVSLSITRVNPTFFRYSRSLHMGEDLWWCILSLDPVILSHPNVTFATTNNIWSGCKRATGPDGLRAMFEPRVERFPSKAPAQRTEAHLANWTTCEEAEVLYPIEVGSEFVRRIYFAKAEHLQTGRAQIETLGHPPLDLVLQPEMLTR
jgi:hypothetical protein